MSVSLGAVLFCVVGWPVYFLHVACCVWWVVVGECMYVLAARVFAALGGAVVVVGLCLF